MIEAGEPSEIALVKLFHSYCPNGEISKKGFTTLLRDANVYDKELTQFDAEFTFDRAKAKCLAAGSHYQDQVIHNKRLTYQIFRILLLPDTASMKKQSIDKFIQVLVNAIPVEEEVQEESTKVSNGPNAVGANSTARRV